MCSCFLSFLYSYLAIVAQSVKFHPNSNYVATGSADKSVRFWDVQTGRCVRVFTGHPGAVQTVALSPDGRTLASAGEDGLVMLWDIASGKRLKRLAGHKGVVYSLSFTVDNGMLASGGADGCVRLWDVRKAGKDDGTAGMDEYNLSFWLCERIPLTFYFHL